MKNYAVLIPTKGRASALTRLFQSCPSLNAPSTYVGVDGYASREDAGPYTHLLRRGGFAGNTTIVPVDNPGGYTSVAREQLRQAAVSTGYTRYVLADDNCRFTDEALVVLLRAQTLWPGSIMAGGHPTAKHFHADRIAHASETRSGVMTYSQVGMIFWCVPHKLYKTYTYPSDCYFDDVHFILHCFTKGFTDFRCCLDAKFDKHLHEPGGTGTVAQRIRKRGTGFVRLATDFPQWMTTSILQTRVPYTKIAEAVEAGRRGFE